MPPMLPADAAVNARFSRKMVGSAHPTGAHAATCKVYGPGPFSVHKTHFLVIFWGVYLLGF